MRIKLTDSEERTVPRGKGRYNINTSQMPQPSRYGRAQLNTNAVPTRDIRRFMFGFRLKAKSEHEATQVRRWYEDGTGMVGGIYGQHDRRGNLRVAPQNRDAARHAATKTVGIHRRGLRMWWWVGGGIFARNRKDPAPTVGMAGRSRRGSPDRHSTPCGDTIACALPTNLRESL